MRKIGRKNLTKAIKRIDWGMVMLCTMWWMMGMYLFGKVFGL